MKTFEEKFTAWVDGELQGSELSDFEAELAKVDGAELDRIASRQMGDLLREHGRAPALQNEDFFNLQIMQRIEAELPKPAARKAPSQSPWSLARLAFAGAFSLLVAGGFFYMMIPAGSNPKTNNLTEIINTHSDDPNITATAFYSKQNDVTVLWLDGQKYMPDKHTAQEKHSEKHK